MLISVGRKQIVYTLVYFYLTLNVGSISSQYFKYHHNSYALHFVKKQGPDVLYDLKTHAPDFLFSFIA